MSKEFALVLTILLALVSLVGYRFLDETIRGGEIQIADGQRQFERGNPTLRRGK